MNAKNSEVVCSSNAQRVSFISRRVGPLALGFLALAVASVAAAQPITDANWVSLGGSPGMYHNIYAIVVDTNGDVYVGGYTEIAGEPVCGVAEWNGSAWSRPGTGLDEWVYALALDGSGNLYAAGIFDYVAEWNGSTWTTTDTANFGYALAFDNSGNLYEGSCVGEGQDPGGIEEWNGSTWSAVGGGMNPGSLVFALAFDGSGNLYVGGQFGAVGGVNAANIAKWNGSAWSALGSGMGGSPPSGICEVSALACDSFGNLYAGGSFTTAGGVSANSIAEWNGSTWSALGSGMSDYLCVCALAFDNSGNLYAGGLFNGAGTNAANSIAKALLTGPTPNQLSLANLGPSTNVITFLGTPGSAYALDLATDLTPPVNWMPQTTNMASTDNAATAGYLYFTNAAPFPQGFYRTRYVPQ